VNRRVFLPARCCSRGVFHRDHFGGVHHVDGDLARIVLPQEFANAILLPDEDDGNAVLKGGVNRSFDLYGRPAVTTHRINSDFDPGHEDLFLSGFDDFPIFVIAAMRTGAMRHAHFVAVRTLGERSSR
jgi:hypothetical protein